MGGTRNIVVGSVAKGPYVRIDRITRFVGRDVKTGNTRPPKLLYELNCLQALGFGVVSQRAQYQAGFPPGRLARPFQRFVYSLYNVLRRETFFRV